MSLKENYKAFKEACEQEYSIYDGLTIYQKYNYFLLKIFFELEDDIITLAINGLGSHDRGVDAIVYNDEEKIIYLCQFKTTDIDSHKSIESNKVSSSDLAKLKVFMDKIDLPSSKNERIEEERVKIKNLTSNDDYRIEFHFFHMGADISKMQEAEKLQINLHCFEEIFLKSREYLDKAELVGEEGDDIQKDCAKGSYKLECINGVNFLKIPTSTSRESYIGVVGAESLFNLHEKVEKNNENNSSLALYSNNVRYKLGSSKVNKAISQTIIATPELFYYFNNGITITCSECKFVDNEKISITLTSPSIINGAQTMNSLINTIKRKQPQNWRQVSILCRVIVRQNNDFKFIKNLSFYNNFHNPVKDTDFLANRTEQRALYVKFQEVGIFYEYKRGLRHTQEYTLIKPKLDIDVAKNLKLTISSLCQILVSARGEPHLAKNIKETLMFEAQAKEKDETKAEKKRAQEEEDYFKTIFNVSTTEEVNKLKDESEKKKIRKGRFKEILVSVYTFNAIERNIKQFEKARKQALEKMPISEEPDFLKGKNHIWLTEFAPIVDFAYIILSCFWYIFDKKMNDKKILDELVEKLAKIENYKVSKNQIDIIINKTLFDLCEIYLLPVIKGQIAQNINSKNFAKQKDAIQVFYKKIDDKIDTRDCPSKIFALNQFI